MPVNAIPGRQRSNAAGPVPVASSAFRALPSLRLHLVARLAEREAESDYQRRFGLRLIEARVVGLAGASSGITLTRLCAELDLEKAYASRLVTRLAARGLVVGAPNPADRRSTLLRATPEGEVLRQAIYVAASERNARLMAALPIPRRKAFLHDLTTLMAALRKGSGTTDRRPSGAATWLG